MNSNIWPAQLQVMLCVTQHTFNCTNSEDVTNDRVMLSGKLLRTFSAGVSVTVTDIYGFSSITANYMCSFSEAAPFRPSVSQ
jgi:hypothetical protein